MARMNAPFMQRPVTFACQGVRLRCRVPAQSHRPGPSGFRCCLSHAATHRAFLQYLAPIAPVFPGVFARPRRRDRCSRCWTPIGQDNAYCGTCGHVSLAFDSLPLERGERCFIHNNRAAEWTCCLCQRPICRECCARETHPLTTFGPLWHCRRCVDAAQAIEAKFLETANKQNRRITAFVDGRQPTFLSVCVEPCI